MRSDTADLLARDGKRLNVAATVHSLQLLVPVQAPGAKAGVYGPRAPGHGVCLPLRNRPARKRKRRRRFHVGDAQESLLELGGPAWARSVADLRTAVEPRRCQSSGACPGVEHEILWVISVGSPGAIRRSSGARWCVKAVRQRWPVAGVGSGPAGPRSRSRGPAALRDPGMLRLWTSESPLAIWCLSKAHPSTARRATQSGVLPMC